jgi:uncharacterized protein YbaR (Trm112 family)
MHVMTATRGSKKENRSHTTSLCDGPNSLPTLPRTAEIPPPLTCLHCAATQASVRRDRQILSARLGYPADSVCCDCETGNACPRCRGENLEYGIYDCGTDAAGYADCGERYYCRDCGAAGDVDDAVPALVMLPQPARQPMTPASGPVELPEVA